MSVSSLNAHILTAKMVKRLADGRTIIADLPVGKDINDGSGEFWWMNRGWQPLSVYEAEIHRKAEEIRREQVENLRAEMEYRKKLAEESAKPTAEVGEQLPQRKPPKKRKSKKGKDEDVV